MGQWLAAFIYKKWLIQIECPPCKPYLNEMLKRKGTKYPNNAGKQKQDERLCLALENIIFNIVSENAMAVSQVKEWVKISYRLLYKRIELISTNVTHITIGNSTFLLENWHT